MLNQSAVGRSSTVRQLANPINVRFLFSRANLLGLALKNEWGVGATLAQLPAEPEWSINGTTAENGKRFRFKRSELGDYELGYAGAHDFPLATALAVSAAFPGGFGPLRLGTKGFIWRRREWNVPIESEDVVRLPYKVLHLYDGAYMTISVSNHFSTPVAVCQSTRGLPLLFLTLERRFARVSRTGP